MQRELRFLIRFKSDAARVLKTSGAQFKKLGVTVKAVSLRLKEMGAQLLKAALAGKVAGFSIGTAMKKIGAATTRVIATIRTFAATLAALGLGIGLIAAISITAQFGQAMSRVQAITGELARDLMGNLNPTFAAINDTVRNLGATTVFTASQAAGAFGLLSQAGFDAGEAINAVAAVLDLAVVGAIDLATSANIVSNAIRGFGLDASDAQRVADIFAGTITKANTNVQELGEALKFVAPIAASLGVSIEEASAAIGLLSDAGLKGTLAGTGLRRVLIGLASTTPKAGETLRKAGIDAEGLADAIGEQGLVGALEKFEGRSLDAAQAVEVFGLRGGPAFLVLQRLSKEAGSFTEALEDMEGRAKEFAKVARDNLAGDLKLLRSVIEDVILGSGELNKTFRDIVQTITGVIQAFNGTLDPLDQNAAKFRQIAENVKTAGKALVIFVKALIALKILSILTALGSAFAGAILGVSAATAVATGGLIAFKFALLATGIGAFIVLLGAAAVFFVKFRNETSAVTKQVGDMSTAIDKGNEILERLKGATGDIALQQLPGLRKAFEDTNKQIEASRITIGRITNEIGVLRKSTSTLADVFGSKALTTTQKFRAALKGLLPGFTAASVAAEILSEEQLPEIVDGFVEATKEANKFGEALKKLEELEAAQKTLRDIARASATLQTALDETAKGTTAFKDVAEDAFDKLNIKIGDLSLGVGEAADLQRKINEQLREAKLVVTLPKTLVDLEVKALAEVTKAQVQFKEALAASKVEGVENASAIVENAKGIVAAAEANLVSVRDTIKARATQRQGIIDLVGVEQMLILSNKEATKVAMDALKEDERRIAAQKKLKITTEALIADVQLEIMLLGASARERKAAAFAQELLNKAIEAGLPGLTAQQQKLIEVNAELEKQRRTNIGAALSKQLKDFIDEGTDAAKLFGDAFGSILGDLEDQIVSFVKTGKFEFREFAASILDTFIQLGVKLALSGALANIQKALAGGPVPGAPAGGPGAQAQAAAALPAQIKDSGVLDAVKEGSVVAKQCCDAGLSATKVLGEDITDIAKEEGTAGRSQEKGLFDGLFMRIDNFGAALGDFFSKIGGQLKTLATSIIDGLKKAFKAVGDAIVNGLQKLGDFITGLAEVFGDVVGEIGSAVGGAVGDIGAGLGQALESVLGPLTSSITSLLSTAATALTDVAGAIIGPITTALTAVATEAVKALAQVVTSLVTAAADIATGAILATAAGLMLTAATLLISAASFMLIAAPLLISAAILQLTAGGLLIAAAGLLLVAALLQTVAAVLQLAASAILFVAGFLLLAGSGLLLVASLLMIVAALLLIVSAVIPFFAKGGISDKPTAFGRADSFTNPMFFADGGTTTGGDRFPAMLAPNEGIVPLNNNKAIPVEMNEDVGSKVFNTTFNITTPDVAGFNKSRGQIEADMERMLQRASERNN